MHKSLQIRAFGCELINVLKSGFRISPKSARYSIVFLQMVAQRCVSMLNFIKKHPYFRVLAYSPIFLSIEEICLVSQLMIILLALMITRMFPPDSV